VKYVPYKDRRAVASDLKEIYLAPSADAAQAALGRFAEKWDGRYPAISNEVLAGDPPRDIHDERDRETMILIDGKSGALT